MGSTWKRLKGFFFWVPKYGKYGAPHYGCKTEPSCPIPIDWMDQAFKDHDDRKITDEELARILWEGNPENLQAIEDNKSWWDQFYAKGYRVGAGIVFTTIGKFHFERLRQ